MKVIIALMLLLAIVFAQSPELEKCLKEKCTDKYDACKKKSGCEDKLRKCVDKCGEKVAQTCWTLCLGVPGAAADVALCAVNQGCLSNVSKIDSIGLNLMGAINTYIEE